MIQAPSKYWMVNRESNKYDKPKRPRSTHQRAISALNLATLNHTFGSHGYRQCYGRKMMSDPPSTDDIILDRCVQGTDSRRGVDWAVGMLMQGYDTDYLCRLAGQLPPFDLGSIAIFRDRALTELGFDDLSNDTLICCTVANALQRHRTDDLTTRKVLESAKCLCVACRIRELQPLYLLAHGLDQLEEIGEQWYVEDMNQGNKSQNVKHVVDAFVLHHAKSPKLGKDGHH